VFFLALLKKGRNRSARDDFSAWTDWFRPFARAENVPIDTFCRAHCLLLCDGVPSTNPYDEVFTSSVNQTEPSFTRNSQIPESLKKSQRPQTQCISETHGYWARPTSNTAVRRHRISAQSHCNTHFSVRYKRQIPFGQKSSPHTFNIPVLYETVISPFLHCW